MDQRNTLERWLSNGIRGQEVVGYTPSTINRVRRAVQEGVLQGPTFQRLGGLFQIRQFAALPVIVHPENLEVALANIELQNSKVLYSKILADRESIANAIEEVNFTDPKTTSEAISMINEGLKASGQAIITGISNPPDSPPTDFLLSLLYRIRSIKVDKDEENRRILLSNSDRLQAIEHLARCYLQELGRDEKIAAGVFDALYNSVSNFFRPNLAAIIGFNSQILEFEAYKDPQAPLDTVHVRIPKDGLPLEVIEGLEVVK